MDAHVFTAMMEKYSPWLMKWIVYRTGQCKTPSQTDEGFQRILAAKVKSVTALPWTDLSTGRETLPSTTPVEGVASRFIIVLKYHVALWKKREKVNSLVKYNCISINPPSYHIHSPPLPHSDTGVLFCICCSGCGTHPEALLQ